MSWGKMGLATKVGSVKRALVEAGATNGQLTQKSKKPWGRVSIGPVSKLYPRGGKLVLVKRNPYEAPHVAVFVPENGRDVFFTE